MFLVPRLGRSVLHAYVDEEVRSIESNGHDDRGIVEVLGEGGVLQSFSDFPARILAGIKGTRYEWYDHGMLSRTTGPARIHPDGTGEWWFQGVKLADPTKQENPALFARVSGATCKVIKLQTKQGVCWGKDIERPGDDPGSVFVVDALSGHQDLVDEELTRVLEEKPDSEFEHIEIRSRRHRPKRSFDA